MSRQQLNGFQDGTIPYASGTIASNTGDGVKTLYQYSSMNMTFNNANTYTVQIKGIYFIHGQQLVQTGGSAIYWSIQVNGATTKYGWLQGNFMQDAIVSDLRECNVGDTIRFHMGAITSAWEGAHSAYQIFMVRRTG